MTLLGLFWVVLFVVFLRAESRADAGVDAGAACEASCDTAAGTATAGDSASAVGLAAGLGPASRAGQSVDFFTNFGAYMPRIHCLAGSDGKPDWPWISALIVLSAGIIIAYLRIYVFWCRAYLSEDEQDRNVKLMDLAQVFLWCAICGYASSILMFVWPAYRLVAVLLVILNVWSWRFALNLKSFRVSFSARRYRRLAETDPLTGLLNRTAIRQRIEQLIAEPSNRGDAQVCVFFLDLDRFKMLNDSLGHVAGDALICQVAERLQHFCADCSRPPHAEWTPARMGGDEFVVVAADTEADRSFQSRGEEMISLLQEAYTVCEHRWITSTSIGMCVLGDRTKADAVLRDADLAMYESKRQGRRRLVRFDQSIEQEQMRRMRLAQDLRTAIDEGTLSIRYQPIVSIERRSIVGAEATMHWLHAELGEISTPELVSVAEDASMTGVIGLWALDLACRQLADWHRNDNQLGLTVSVKLFGTHLREAGMAEQIADTVRNAGVTPTNVRLEFSEDALISSMDVSASVLDVLRKQGFKIDMDQFGAGVSSLRCLHTLRLDRLNIDPRLTANIDKRDHAAVLQALITLAQNLGFELVAKGVDQPEHVAALLALDCTLAQGSLFGEPVHPGPEAPALEMASLFEPVGAG